MSKSNNLELINTELALANDYSLFKAENEKSTAVTLNPFRAKNTEFEPSPEAKSNTEPFFNNEIFFTRYYSASAYLASVLVLSVYFSFHFDWSFKESYLEYLVAPPDLSYDFF